MRRRNRVSRGAGERGGRDERIRFLRSKESQNGEDKSSWRREGKIEAQE